MRQPGAGPGGLSRSASQPVSQGQQADAGERGELVALAQVGQRLTRLRLADPRFQGRRGAEILSLLKLSEDSLSQPLLASLQLSR